MKPAPIKAKRITSDPCLGKGGRGSHPFSIAVMRGLRGFDELHADEAVDAGGDRQLTHVEAHSVAPCPQYLGEIEVKVREGFQEALGVTQAWPSEPHRVFGQRRHALR